MNKELKESIAFIINLNSQILENQINAMNGKLTNKGLEKSQILVRDCVEFINNVPVKKKGEKGEPKSENLEVNDIFNAWNKLDALTSHAKVGQHAPAIKKLLRNSTKEEIINSFINYATILADPSYIWTKKWTLSEFATRGFLRFHDEANPFENISKAGDYANRANKQTIISNEAKAEYTSLFKS